MHFARCILEGAAFMDVDKIKLAVNQVGSETLYNTSLGNVLYNFSSVLKKKLLICKILSSVLILSSGLVWVMMD
jgi:hypothetical protein